MNNTGREGEEALFDIIRSPRPDDDGSQYLNPSGEGMMFDEDERIDEDDNNDDKGNVLQITKTGEVYLLYKPSGDHYMY
jgi:hypothetical protein